MSTDATVAQASRSRRGPDLKETVRPNVPAPLLIDAFEHLVGAAGGTEAMRGLVLLLAVQGRLIDEEPLPVEMTPCSDRLTVAVGLPQGWTWRRVEEVGELKLGRQRSPKNHNGPNMRPYLRVANVFEARIDTADVMEMNFDPEEAERFRLLPNDLLLNEGQSYELVGRPAIYRGEVPGACFQNTLIRFRPAPYLLPEYALSVFRAYMRTGRFRREAQQTTNIAHLSLGRLAQIEFPLPPLAEQKRIVEKVDQLMALCDELEARQAKKRDLSDRLTKSALSALTSAETPEDFDTAWQRVVDNFDTLIDRKEKVGELRNIVHDLAVHGRLSQVAAGPDGLPDGWRWARADELVAQQRHALAIGPFGSSLLKADYTPAGVPLVFVRDITSRTFGGANTRFISPEKARELAAHRVEPGDLLITKKGSPPGDTAIYPPDRPSGVVTADCIKLTPNRATTSAGFLEIVLAARSVKAKILEITKGVAHQKISLRRFREVPLPLPPRGEQERIIAKVEQLMKVCNELEERLTTSEELASKLVEAVVKELVA